MATIQDAIDLLQSIITTGEASSVDLRKQRDDLVAQRQQIDAQIAALNTQITAAEGSDANNARAALNAVKGIAVRSTAALSRAQQIMAARGLAAV